LADSQSVCGSEAPYLRTQEDTSSQSLLGYALAMPKEPKPDNVTAHEETDSSSCADDHDFYKGREWTSDETRVDGLLMPATVSLGPARCSSARSSIGHA
jgi:hypothetical protein